MKKKFTRPETIFPLLFLGSQVILSFMNYFLEGLKHAIFAFAALAIYLMSQKKRPLPGRLFLPGLIWGSSALFFLPSAPGFPQPSLDALYRFLHYPVPDWDILLLGMTWHRFFLFHSLLLPILFLEGSRKFPSLKDLARGLAVGMASHLIWDGATGARITQVVFLPGVLALQGQMAWLWLLANGFLLFALITLFPKKY